MAMYHDFVMGPGQPQAGLHGRCVLESCAGEVASRMTGDQVCGSAHYSD